MATLLIIFLIVDLILFGVLIGIAWEGRLTKRVMAGWDESIELMEEASKHIQDCHSVIDKKNDEILKLKADLEAKKL
jgi:hypothetical protein